MPIKRTSMLGLEIEMFMLNQEGRMINKADTLLKALEGKRLGKYVKPELSTSMIELTSAAKPGIRECAVAFMENLDELVDEAEKMGYRLLPLGIHPTRFVPKLHTKMWYEAKRQVLGTELTKREGKICGFHYHFTLPEGIVGRKTSMIKSVERSISRQVFLQQYNFLVATDPAILAFCQSSPIWNGVHYGKDCRVLVYRDMKATHAGHTLKGIHYYLPMFGALPNYEFTLQDLRVMSEQKKTEWLKILEQRDFPTNEIASYPTLKFMWGPLRVNKIGTIEYRGPDMNHPELIFSVSSLLKYALEAIEKNEYRVRPSDIGISEPFVLEGNKIYVPPHSTLKYLERQSVIRGLESPEVYNYCKSLFDLVCKITKKGKSRNFRAVKRILDSKKTLSDDILDMVKKNGYSLDEEIPEDMLNHIALYHADRLSKESGSLLKLFSKFSE